MELEEMKSVWTEMSGQIEKQKRITDKLIINMIEERYHRALSGVSTSEKLATVLCVVFALTVLVNFDKYQNALTITCAVLSVAFLLIFPYLSLRAIHKMNHLNIQGNDMKQTLDDFAKTKTHWLAVQRWSYYLAPVLGVAILPVSFVIMLGKEYRPASNAWLWYMPVFFLFYILICRWVYGCYVRATVRMEKVLKELEE